MTKRRDAGLNDPGRWASVACELPPDDFMEHEDFPWFFQLPFDICMQLANGNKKMARALHWGQWASMKEQDNESDKNGNGPAVAGD